MRWAPTSVRVRLTSWYATTLAIVLLLYVAGVLLFLRHALWTSFDRQLIDDVEAAEELLTRSDQGTITRRAEQHDANDEDRWIEVWSQSGTLAYQSEPAKRMTVPPWTDVASRDSRTQSVVSGDGTRLRVLTRRAWVGGAQMVMRVARSEEFLRHEMGELVAVMAVGLPFAIGIAALGGYALARRALAPIDRMRQHATLITAERLKDRLPVDNPDDELGRLAATFNEMLARLDGAFDQMRQFTADASHELRTPLTALRTVGEVTLREHRDETAYHEAIGSMLEEVDRLTRLVDGLLALARAEAGQAGAALERVDLGALAADAVGHLQVLAEEKQQSISIEAPREVVASADRLLIRQALINLLDNAIKYSPVGTAIRVRVRTALGDAALEVTDAGPGIPAEHRERIFDRFYRVDAARSREGGGMGLGLAIARRAVEISGGWLEVEPAPRTGSTFRIRLRSAAF